ncbi:DDE-type integrase/transposase/recombinase [Streptomyces sp. NPDC055092]
MVLDVAGGLFLGHGRHLVADRDPLVQGRQDAVLHPLVQGGLPAGSCANSALSPASRGRRGSVSPRPRPARCWTSSAVTSPDAPGEKLDGDIAYIATGEGWLHLATVIDCCTKEVIGYAMDDHYQTPLISRAIRRAARKRNLSVGAIFPPAAEATTCQPSPEGRSTGSGSVDLPAAPGSVSTTPWPKHSSAP